MRSDQPFMMNEAGNAVRDRLAALHAHPGQFDVLFGDFHISGFRRIYRVLVGAEEGTDTGRAGKTDRGPFHSLQEAKQRQRARTFRAETHDALPRMILDEFERSEDTPQQAMTARS